MGSLFSSPSKQAQQVGGIDQGTISSYEDWYGNQEDKLRGQIGNISGSLQGDSPSIAPEALPGVPEPGWTAGVPGGTAAVPGTGVAGGSPYATPSSTPSGTAAGNGTRPVVAANPFLGSPVAVRGPSIGISSSGQTGAQPR